MTRLPLGGQNSKKTNFPKIKALQNRLWAPIIDFGAPKPDLLVPIIDYWAPMVNYLAQVLDYEAAF